MYSVCIIVILVCFVLIYTVLANPSIKIGKYRILIPYWADPVLGSLSLLIFGLLPWKTMWNGLTLAGSINPLKILVLFISMTTLSIYLDEVGSPYWLYSPFGYIFIYQFGNVVHNLGVCSQPYDMCNYLQEAKKYKV